MNALASVADLAAFTGRELDDANEAALLALDLASALVRAETRQTISRVDGDTVTLQGRVAAIQLPERPIIDVPTVEGFSASAYSWDAATGVLRFGYPSPFANRDSDGIWPDSVTVTYSHGWSVIPGDIRSVTLALAARIIARNSQDGMIVSETVGSYSVTYARPTASGETLTPEERRILARYRRVSWAAAQ